MDAKERYYWDLTGYLIVRNVLSRDEIDEINAALEIAKEGVEVRERAGSRGSQALEGSHARWYRGENLMSLPHPHCEPFRKLLANPRVIGRLRVMCGRGFRLDHGPQFNNAVKGTEGLTLHGAGAPHRDMVAYKHQTGKTYCGGVTVTWNLTDCPAGKGGFVGVLGSHKSDYPMPDGVRSCTDDLGSAVNPEIHAGDVLFFMDGAQTHGTHPWQNDWDRRSVLFKYASRTSIRQDVAGCIAPEDYWGKEMVSEMTLEERAVMFGPCSAPRRDDMYLVVEESGSVGLKNPENAQQAT
jgi:ectoine hydroxylase-related dioxygenase (phytanoyl-CoA dioxygenase family)